ncbi:ankyrin and HET domain-containing protein [Colletotrichum tofieldiae]|uniref:Ankyrin and HET domain-containing protein n=1 Tax=Colletotrichum tofieldiae TaxID=708197 RepID=A0A161YFU0_9PEZI|nr:ankyrin and HET domain-containing protein [Colletotrichum tofieldiae]
MATSFDTHAFKPLAGSREIRLLHLAPGKDGFAVHGRLEHVNLDSVPLYEALSYEWGSSERNRQAILQDGSTLQITESLYHALRDIRHEVLSQGSRTVWADAICINQEDIEERQQQVSIMGSIYRKASRVITYIGPEKDDSSIALFIARDLHKHTLSRYGHNGPISLSVQELDRIERQPEYEPHWMALRALVLRPWHIHSNPQIPGTSCKAEQLYITVANKILAKSPTLDILYSNLNKKSLALPSWVPDWSTWQFGSNGAAHHYFYAACAATAAELRLHTSRDKLDISGCFVDKIVDLSDRVEPYYKDHHGPDLQRRKTWLKEQAEIVDRLEPYPDGSDISDVLWRTLIGNVTLEEDDAGDDYKAFFYAHLNCCKDDSAEVKKMATNFCDAVRRRSRYRCLAVTEKGYFGAIPETAAVGDQIWMFQGGRHLFIVRQCEGGFIYIGYAYVHGLMQGEVLLSDWYEKCTITLV